MMLIDPMMVITILSLYFYYSILMNSTIDSRLLIINNANTNNNILIRYTVFHTIETKVSLYQLCGKQQHMNYLIILHIK